MDILYVIFLSVFSLVVLFLLTKLIGYRQMSEMSMFDYINGITIGSIAAELAIARGMVRLLLKWLQLLIRVF